MGSSGQRCRVGWVDAGENERHQFPGLLIKEHLAFMYSGENELEICTIDPTFEANYFEIFGRLQTVICKIHDQNAEEVFKDVESLTFLEFAKKYMFIHCGLNNRQESI